MILLSLVVLLFDEGVVLGRDKTLIQMLHMCLLACLLLVLFSDENKSFYFGNCYTDYLLR